MIMIINKMLITKLTRKINKIINNHQIKKHLILMNKKIFNIKNQMMIKQLNKIQVK